MILLSLSHSSDPTEVPQKIKEWNFMKFLFKNVFITYAPVSINKLNFPNSPSSVLTGVKWCGESTKRFQSVLCGACPRRILLVDLDTKEMLPPSDLHYRYTLFRSTEAAILNPSVVWRNSSELKVIWFSLPIKSLNNSIKLNFLIKSDCTKASRWHRLTDWKVCDISWK